MKDFSVMLAKKFDVKKLSFPCIVSPKLDGIRAVFYKGELYTRNQKVIRGVDHIKKQLFNFALEGISLDGELMVPGIPFQKSSGMIRSFNETPEAVYYVFDIPSHPGNQEDRLRKLEELEEFMGGNLVLVPHVICNESKHIQQMYKSFRAQGFEGAMVKAIDGLYENKRSSNWLKMKEVETYDVECVGFFEGKGRLTGTLGGIIVELDGVRIRVGGGFSDQDRDHIWRCRDQYRGTVCEIASQEMTPSGSLRHPRFITWRPDIEAA